MRGPLLPEAGARAGGLPAGGLPAGGLAAGHRAGGRWPGGRRAADPREIPLVPLASEGRPTHVVFGQRPRPEDGTEVHLPDWDGPLGLLLALVEARRLDVLTVPLGDLAGAYLDALATLEGDRIGHVSAFVAVASQLILIKSRALLPRPPDPGVPMPDEGADPEAELRTRLLLYRIYRDAAGRLQDRALEGFQLARRDPALAGATARAHAVAPEPPRLDVGHLVRALDRMARAVPPPPPPPEVVPRAITLAERAAAIRGALARAGSLVLQELLAGVTDRVVVAVTFLAMLELVKQREVSVDQAEPWGPITVRRLVPPSAAPSGGGRR